MADAPRRVVLSGYYGFGNLGDDALFEVLAERLLAAGCEEIVVPAGDPRRLPAMAGVRPVGRLDVAAVNAALRAGAVLLSGGGGLLQDATSRRSLAYYLGLLALARRHRRPYAVAFCSLGPLRSRLGRAAAGSLLRGAAAVVLRDSGSVRLASELGVPLERVIQSRDLAFALALPAAAEPGDRVALCLRPTAHRERVLAAVADWAGRQDRPLQFVPFADEDAAFGRELAGRVPSLNVGPKPNTVQAACEALGGCRLVVAQRLHALILAIRLGRPAVAIPYDPKVTALAADFELPSTGDEAALEEASLADAVTRAEAQWEAESRRLSALASEAESRVLADLRTLFERLASADRAC